MVVAALCVLDRDGKVLVVDSALEAEVVAIEVAQVHYLHRPGRVQ